VMRSMPVALRRFSILISRFNFCRVKAGRCAGVVCLLWLALMLYIIPNLFVSCVASWFAELERLCLCSLLLGVVRGEVKAGLYIDIDC
jgi:hypothetical protein